MGGKWPLLSCPSQVIPKYPYDTGVDQLAESASRYEFHRVRQAPHGYSLLAFRACNQGTLLLGIDLEQGESNRPVPEFPACSLQQV